MITVTVAITLRPWNTSTVQLCYFNTHCISVTQKKAKTTTRNHQTQLLILLRHTFDYIVIFDVKAFNVYVANWVSQKSIYTNEQNIHDRNTRSRLERKHNETVQSTLNLINQINWRYLHDFILLRIQSIQHTLECNCFLQKFVKRERIVQTWEKTWSFLSETVQLRKA